MRRAIRRAGAPALAAALLHLVLIQPNHPAAMTWGALRLVPLELPVILAAMLALGPHGAASRSLRGLLTAVLVTLAVWKAADYGTFVAFDRGFNPLVDLHLVVAGWRLGAGAVGAAPAALAVAGAVLLAAGAAVAVWWALRVWARAAPRGRWRGAAGGAAALAAAVAAADAGRTMGAWALPANPPGTAFTARYAAERAVTLNRTYADLLAFDRAAAQDRFAGRTPLLQHIGGRDVLVLFVESYGRASLEAPLYAATHRATLRAAEARLAARGLAMRSAWLTAPTYGGQSWLSHATLATGLWVPDQPRYAAALASRRRSLFHLAAASGFRTAAVMPAITLDWPESARMGFDTIISAADLGYAGPPFNWVTMPDQYTLAEMDRRLRGPGHDRPLFAQVALISSHAPFVPVPEMVPWDAVGDGRVFARWADAGDPPEVVWRDPDRVRAQYRKAVDYSLRTVLDYLARQERPALAVVLGDHQAAGFIATQASRDVPVHLIGPPDLVDRAAAWGWSRGLIPGEDAPVWRMDAVRDRILTTFSAPSALRSAAR